MRGEYRLITNSQDVIIRVDESWVDFARRNWSPDFQPEWVLGRRLWGFICDDATIYLQKMLAEKVRQQDQSLSYPFRCDSPALRRFLEMTVSPLPEGGLLWHSRLLGEETRPPFLAPPLTPARGQASGFLLAMCSWCKRVREPEPLAGEQGRPPVGHWQELEEVMPLLAQRGRAEYPAVTHTICPVCYQQVKAQLEEAKPRGPAGG